MTENEIIYARLIRNGRVANIYIKLEPVDQAHAEGVLEAIDRGMKKFGDSEWQWKERLVATGSDGASVNLGRQTLSLFTSAGIVCL